MAVKINETERGKIAEIQVSGKLTHEDYGQFVPEFERLIQEHGKIRILFEMRDFHGWKFAALWDDMKFDLKHFSHIERLAMVGDKAWEKGMSAFCRPFTTAQIRYFDQTALDEARTWIAGLNGN
ncbi:MAG: STAS/SEC14 domain-containing protein [Acidobacteriota bacterium]